MDRLVTSTNRINQIVDERSNHLCEVCEGNNMVQRHHIIGGQGKRIEHQNQYSVIMLCYDCHHGNEGVHGINGRTLDITLKLELQDRYKDMGFSKETIRELMGGRLYSYEDMREKVGYG